MYSINGHSLTQPEYSWRVISGTELTAAVEVTRPNLTTPGADGSVPMPGVVSAPVFAIIVGTTLGALEPLRVLLTQPELTLTKVGQNGSLAVELVSFTPTRVGIGDNPEHEVKIILQAPGVWFRDTETTSTQPLNAASKTVSVFPGISGKVHDALVRVTDCTNPKIKDSAGTWIAYTGTIPAGSYLRFNCKNGKGFITTTDTWTGGTEVDHSLITFGRGPNTLVLTPSFTLTPAERTARLTVTTSARGDTAQINVRGRNAYSI